MDVVFDQQGTAQYPHDLEDRSAEFEVVFDNGDEAIGDDGHMNLYPDSILGLTPKCLDAEMLLDPLEEKFHLPSVSVKQGDVLGRKVEVVSIVDERPAEVWCIIDDTSEVGGIIPFVPFAGETDSLVEQDIVLSVDRHIPSGNLEIGMPFLANDEESSERMYGEKSCKVKVSAVEDITGTGLVCEPVHGLGVVLLGIGDAIEYGNLGDDVNLGVYADAGLGAAEMRPSEDRHAEVDGCGIHSIEPPVEFKLLCESPLLGQRYHIECKLLENPGVAEHVRFRESVPDDGRRTKTEIVRPFSMSGSDICEFPKTSTPHKLSEDKHKQMIPMGKSPFPCPVVILRENSPEPSLRKKHGDLCENILPNVHNDSSFLVKEPNIRISNVGHKFYRTNLCA